MEADVKTPFLHLGLGCKINSRPNAEHILVQVKPKKLPHKDASEKYNSLNDWENTLHIERHINMLEKYLTTTKPKPGLRF